MAAGRTILRDCRVVNVFSGEVFPSDIVIRSGRISAVTPVGLEQATSGDTAIDCGGLFATPGLMDAHVHTESTLLSLREIARLVVPHGTTSLFINPHEIANVMGLPGIRRVLAEAVGLPLHVFLIAPCKVPVAPGLETTGATFGIHEVREMLGWPETVGAGEFDAADVLAGSAGQLALLEETRIHRKARCGHAPGLSGADLQVIVAAGLSDDHESHGVAEALDKLRSGMTVFLREGTTERNVKHVIRGLVAMGCDLANFPRLAFCTDDKHPLDILENGHINLNMRLAVEAGMPAAAAVRAATLACAEHYGLSELGALAPGMAADVVLFPDLSEFRPSLVVFGGEVVARDGRLLLRGGGAGAQAVQHGGAVTKADLVGRVGLGGDCHESEGTPPASVANCGDLSDLESRLVIRLPGAPGAPVGYEHDMDESTSEWMSAQPDQVVGACVATVIGVSADQILTKRLERTAAIGSSGAVVVDSGRGLNKVSVLDRYSSSGRVGLALIEGFSILDGAIASSVAHDHHNFVAVGDGDANLAEALRELARLGGGLVAVASGRVVARLPLPTAGLMTDLPFEAVNAELARLNAAASAMGCTLPAPFMTLSFVTLPVVPELGITDMGLIDVARREVIAAVR